MSYFRLLLLLSALSCSFGAAQLGAMDAQPAGHQPAEAKTFGRFHATDCPICLIPLDDTGALDELPCGHVLHHRCYEGWQRSETCQATGVTCPACRTPDVFAHAVEHLYRRGADWQMYFHNCILADPAILSLCDGHGNTLLQHALEAAITVNRGIFGSLAEQDREHEALIVIILELIHDPRTLVTRARALAPLRILHPIGRPITFEEDDRIVESDEIGEDDELQTLSSTKSLAKRLGDHRVLNALGDRLAAMHPAVQPVISIVDDSAEVAFDQVPGTPPERAHTPRCPGAPERKRSPYQYFSDASDDEGRG